VSAVGIGALVLIWAANARIALVPETFYDALVYHLGLPQLYVNAGRLVPAEWNSYAGIPSQTQMLNVLALSVDATGVVANLLHAATLPLIWAAFCATGISLGSVSIGWWAAGVFTLTPVVLAESIRASVGLELALMQVGFLAACLSGSKEADPARRRGWLVLAGTSLGSAAATKYNAWILPLALVAFISRRRDGFEGRREGFSPTEAGIILGVSLLWLAPWVLKNAMHYHNPVFPAFHALFAGSSGYAPDWSVVARPNSLSGLLTPSGLWTFLTHPIGMLAPTEDVSESIGVVAMTGVCLAAMFRLDPLGRRLLVFCGLCWVPLSFFSTLTRYFLPHLAVFSVFVARVLVLQQGNGWRPIKAIFIFWMAVTGGAWIVFMGGWSEKLAVFAGGRTSAQFLSNASISYPTPQFSAIEYVNSAAGLDDGVMLFGDPRGLFLKRRFVSSTVDQPNLLETWANQAGTAEALALRFQAEGIRFILSNQGEFSRRRVSLRLSDAGKRALDRFWTEGTERVFSRRENNNVWVEVRRVKD